MLNQLRTALAGLSLLAFGLACAPAGVVPPTVDQGTRIDHATLEGFQRGVTTRDEAVRILGEPSTTVHGAEGTTTLAWNYLHSDAHGALAITTILTFGPDDKLQIKLMNQSSQTH